MIKTGAWMVKHARHAVFHLSVAALPRAVFAGILDLIHDLIDDLRGRATAASA